MLLSFILACDVDSNREELVRCNGLPVLLDLLQSSDRDVQYYTAAALSNIAVNGKDLFDQQDVYVWCCTSILVYRRLFYRCTVPILWSARKLI